MKKLTIFLLLLLVNFSVFSQILFQSVIGKLGSDSCYSIIQKPDSGFLVVGMVDKISVTKFLPTSASLISLSKDGRLLSSRFFESGDNKKLSIDRAFDITKTSAGGYVILTDVYDMDIASLIPPNLDIGFIQLTADLSVNKTKRLGRSGDLAVGPVHEQGISIIEASGGGFLVAGTYIDSSSTGDSIQQPCIIKTKADFKEDWSKYLKGFVNGVAVDVIEDKNNQDVIIVGNAEVGVAKRQNIFIQKFNKNGSFPTSPIFVVVYGNDFDDVATKVIQTNNGDFLIVGAINIDTPNPEIIVIKLNNDFTEQWVEILSSSGNFAEYPTSVIETYDHNYILSGQVYSAAGVDGASDAFLIKIDQNGGIIGSRVYGGPGQEIANDVFETADNGLIFCGTTNSTINFGANGSDMYLVKTDESGQSGCYERDIVFNNLAIPVYREENPGGVLLDLNNPPTKDFVLPAFSNTLLNDSLVCNTQALNVYLPKFDVVCFGNAITIGDSITGGEPPYSIQWSPNYNISNDTIFPTVVSPTVDTTYTVIVIDNKGVKKIDSIFINVVPNDSSWTGLNNPYCTSSMMSILTPTEPGAWFEGDGVNFNGIDWYFDPAIAGQGTHPITYFSCIPNTKNAIVNPAPCIQSVVQDTSGGAVVQPQGLFTDCDGQIYLTDATYILRIDTLGTTHRVAGKTDTIGFIDGYILDATLNAPIGLTKTPDGIIYFVDGGNHAVRMIRNDTVYTIVNVGGTPGDNTNTNGAAAQLRKPFGITYDIIRNCLYVSEAEQTTGQVKKIDLNSPVYWTTDLIGGGANPINSPQTGLNAQFDIVKHLSCHNDDIFITESNKHVVYRYDINTDIIDIYAGQYGSGGVLDGPLATATLLNPTGISVNCSGEMYVAENSSSLLRKIDDTQVTTYFGNPFSCDPNALCNPSAVSVFVKGFIDIANTGAGDIKRMTIKDWDIAPWIGLDTDNVYCPGEANDTIKPLYSCGSYGPAFLIADDGFGNWIFNPPLIPGHYRIYYDYRVGYCDQRVYKDLWVSDIPSVNLADSVGICAPDSALLEPLTYWPGNVKFLWSTNDTVKQIKVDLTGIFKLTVKNTNGCTATDSTNVIIKPTFNIDPGVDKSICYGDITTLGGMPLTNAIDPTVRWWPGNNLNDSTLQNPDALPLSSTRYYVWVRDKYNCRSVDSVFITVDSLPIVDAGIPGTVCAGDTITIGGSPTASGTIGTYLFDWQPSATLSDAAISNPVASPSIQTDYIINVTDGNTCKWADTVTIFVNSVPKPTATSVDAAICNGGNTQLNVAIVGGTFPFGYVWMPGLTLSDSAISNPIATPVTTTKYTVEVSDLNGCKDTSSVEIAVVVPFVNIADANPEICRGDSIQLQASGGSTYAWLPVAGLSNPSIANPWASPVNTTAYTVTISIPGGCTDDTVVNVTVLDLPIPSVSYTDSSICNGKIIVMEASGSGLGGSYEWLPNVNIANRLTAMPSVNPSSNQTYTVTVTDINGCKDYSAVNITVDALPVATASSNSPVCEGNPINLTGGPNPIITFAWSGPNSYSASGQNPSIAVSNSLMQGTYTLTVTDINGCIDTETTDVIVTTLSASVSNNGPVCEGNTVNLTSLPNGLTSYTWSGPSAYSSSSQNPNLISTLVAMAGKYTVTVSDGTCNDTASTIVNILAIPNANVDFGDTTICSGTNVQLNASGGISYTWLPASNLSNTSISNPVADPLSDVTYTVKVSNGTCTDDTFVNVTVNLVDISVDNPLSYVCENSSVSLDVTGSATLLYNWIPSTYLNNANLQSPTATNVLGDLTYTVTGIDAWGCSNNDTLLLRVSLGLKAYAGENDTICSGLSKMLGGTGPPFSLTAEGGISPYSYSWLPTAGLDDPASDNPMATITSTISYVVTINDLANCTDMDTVDVEMYLLPNADAGLDDTICYSYSDTIGGLITAGGTVGPYIILWTPSTGLDSADVTNPIASPIQTTTYSVKVTDANSCDNSDSMIMNVLPVRGVNFSDTSICFSDSIVLFAQGGTNYSWTPIIWLSNPLIANPLAVPISDTVYHVIITSNFCEDFEDSTRVTVNPLPIIVSGPDTTIFQGEFLNLFASGGDSYLWSPVDDIIGAEDISDPEVRPLHNTDFLVQVINKYSCVAWDTVNILVDETTKEIFIPEAFVPGNINGNNKEVCIDNIGYAEFDFKVFNRWGELVFSTTDPSICWDGTYKGGLLQMQTVGYILKYKDFDGNTFNKTGTITILR